MRQIGCFDNDTVHCVASRPGFTPQLCGALASLARVGGRFEHVWCGTVSACLLCMKTPLLFALLVSAACGSGTLPAVVWVNDSPRPTSVAEDVWATTEGVLGEAINLNGFTIHMHAHIGEGCPKNAAECTSPGAYEISTSWPTASELSSTEAATDKALAGLFCHELMHVHCYQLDGDAYCGVGEAGHDHKAPFDYNNPQATCYAVANLFADGFEQNNEPTSPFVT